MKIYAFVRTRTYYREYDYRLLTPLTVIPSHINSYFSNCVRLLLSDTSNSESDWDTPTWLLIKRDKYLLWGVAVNNQLFSNECFEEEAGDRHVRCFCGVVYVDYDITTLKLPYESQAFQPIFDNVIKKLWRERVSEILNVEMSIGDAAKNIAPSKYIEDLNANPRICRLFPMSSNKERLLSAVLSAPEDNSIAVDVVEENQVCSPPSTSTIAVLNAIMRHGHSIKEIPVKFKCKKCGSLVDRLVDGLCENCRPHIVETTREENDSIEEDLFVSCSKCGKQTTWTNEKGLCEECIRRQKRNQIIRYIILVLISLVVVLKMCDSVRKKEQHYSSISDSESSIDSIALETETINIFIKK